MNDSRIFNKPKLSFLAIGLLPPPIGGVSVSFKIFCEIIAKNDKIDLKIINLSGIHNRKFFLKEVFLFIKQILTYTKKSQVVFLECATPQIPSLGLIILVICRIRRKSFILSKAAGSDYLNLGFFSGRIAEFTIRYSDLFLAQTKQLADLCRSRGINQTYWYPSSRPIAPLAKISTQCRNFVYVGQVRPSKGIIELISISDRLPDNVNIDVYGPFYDGIDEKIFFGRSHISYRGVLNPDDVITTLQHYDAFVLPTKALTEGYPGAILEALSIGLPVISTTIGGIPEIVNEKWGILIEPGNKDALVHAMENLINDDNAYQKLCHGAQKIRCMFSAEYWTDWLVQKCIKLIEEKSKS